MMMISALLALSFFVTAGMLATLLYGLVENLLGRLPREITLPCPQCRKPQTLTRLSCYDCDQPLKVHTWLDKNRWARRILETRGGSLLKPLYFALLAWGVISVLLFLTAQHLPLESLARQCQKAPTPETFRAYGGLLWLYIQTYLFGLFGLLNLLLSLAVPCLILYFAGLGLKLLLSSRH